MNKREFNEIRKRILAQVEGLAKTYVGNDLEDLWYEIKELKKKKC